jgi:alkylation response protein AidB-like acyl-CoA dehydrogenase
VAKKCGEEKTFVVDGHVAELFIVVAHVAAKELGLFLAPRKTAGLTVE